jgi:hypothetical protein
MGICLISPTRPTCPTRPIQIKFQTEILYAADNQYKKPSGQARLRAA